MIKPHGPTRRPKRGDAACGAGRGRVYKRIVDVQRCVAETDRVVIGVYDERRDLNSVGDTHRTGLGEEGGEAIGGRA